MDEKGSINVDSRTDKLSTDALREALQNIISAYDEWANNLDPDFGSARLDDAIDRAKAALAAPSSETEKLPAKWRRLGESVNSLVSYSAVAAELEAALKADRQGSR